VPAAQPETPIASLPGVDADSAAALAGLGIATVYDLLLYLPARYDDWRKITPIRNLRPGVDVRVLGEVRRVQETFTPRRRARMTEVRIADASGEIDVGFFNPNAAKLLTRGRRVLVTGRADFRGKLTLGNAQFELMDRGKPPAFRPVYNASEAVPARRLAAWLPRLVAANVDGLPDPIPRRSAFDVCTLPLQDAVSMLHSPTHATSDDIDAARRRLVVHEAYLLEAVLTLQRESARAGRAVPVPVTDAVDRRIRARLRLTPTADQEQAFADLRADLAGEAPTYRLIQGDVGTGKTAVAVYAMLATAAHRRQAALLAPTETLARQHAQRLCEMLADTDVGVTLLTGSLSSADRAAALAAVRTGESSLIVGTHALLQPDVGFASLTTVVIDEQHKFGVSQRAALMEKSATRPHLLLLSATPIPRTLTLALYGDLDLTTLRTRPPGVQPIETRLVTASKQADALRLLAGRVADGARGYVVCPVVHESDDADRASVEGAAAAIRAMPEFAGLPIGVAHGSLPAAEKESAPADFAAGRTRVLVCSTVIEVGFDVPEATTIVVLDAGRLGATQLHQLRGRVARAREPALCLLVGDAPGEPAAERLRLLRDTPDGFAIAEADLKMRGAGEYFGTRQSGAPRLRIGDPTRDADIFAAANRAARIDAGAGRLDRALIRRLARLHFADADSPPTAAPG
jgi:ATP-dependent DNA helicase RecG